MLNERNVRLLKPEFRRPIYAAGYGGLLLGFGAFAAVFVCTIKALGIPLSDPIGRWPHANLMRLVMAVELAVCLGGVPLTALRALARHWGRVHGWSREEEGRVFWRSDFPVDWIDDVD
jgi:hypothetical protein